MVLRCPYMTTGESALSRNDEWPQATEEATALSNWPEHR